MLLFPQIGQNFTQAMVRESYSAIILEVGIRNLVDPAGRVPDTNAVCIDIAPHSSDTYRVLWHKST
jgi:hypothetical protein